tara:strand:- start:364 stop:606 length:243 start_codon:yes stop_codon:yes gene_type:complete
MFNIISLQNIFIIVGIVLVIIYLGNYISNESFVSEKKVTFNPEVIDIEDYIKSDKFKGYKNGYIFTLGGKGQGYYKDNLA